MVGKKDGSVGKDIKDGNTGAKVFRTRKSELLSAFTVLVVVVSAYIQSCTNSQASDAHPLTQSTALGMPEVEKHINTELQRRDHVLDDRIKDLKADIRELRALILSRK